MGLSILKSKKDEDTLINALFGEVNIATIFPNAYAQLKKRNIDEAIKLLKQRTSDEEDRIRIAAWNELRKLGINPPEEVEKQLLGFVIEVNMNGGRDYLSAYPDHRARYFNYSGAKIFWGNQDTLINQQIDVLMEEAQKVVFQIGVWEQPRRTALDKGMVRLSFLTPSGLHFGEGPFHIFYQDKLACNCILEATKLMKMLTEYKK